VQTPVPVQVQVQACSTTRTGTQPLTGTGPCQSTGLDGVFPEEAAVKFSSGEHELVQRRCISGANRALPGLRPGARNGTSTKSRRFAISISVAGRMPLSYSGHMCRLWPLHVPNRYSFPRQVPALMVAFCGGIFSPDLVPRSFDRAFGGLVESFFRRWQWHADALPAPNAPPLLERLPTAGECGSHRPGSVHERRISPRPSGSLSVDLTRRH